MALSGFAAFPLPLGRTARVQGDDGVPGPAQPATVRVPASGCACCMES